MITRRVVTIHLDEGEESIVSQLATEDGISVEDELAQLLRLQIWEEIQLHCEEV